MPHDAHPASLPAAQLVAQCDAERLRRSGPGGQHRNKVETAVRLCHRPTGVRAEASERRSQAENHGVALRRLRLNLALEIRGRADPARGPTSLWRSRCRDGKILVSASHDDFPALLAEALDMIAVCTSDLPTAATALECTTSQLVKLLKKEPRALEKVNQGRTRAGFGPLQ